MISDDRMRAALRRAAQLQAEAAEKLERDARLRIEAQTGNDVSHDGFRPEDVETTAVEAGVSAEYIRRALVEQDALGEHATELSPWVDRMGDKMLGTRQRSLEISRIMSAEPAAVLEAMQRIFPSAAYGLTLVDSIGGLPLEGGVLIFEMPRFTVMSASSANLTPMSYAATTVDLIQIHVSLRELKSESGTACEVTIRGDLRTSMRRNVWWGAGLSGLFGGGGGVVGLAIGLAAGAMAPVALGVAAVGFAATGGASAAGYGALYRHYLRKMVSELEMLLKVVDTNARTGGAFHPPHPQMGKGRAAGFQEITGV